VLQDGPPVIGTPGSLAPLGNTRRNRGAAVRPDELEQIIVTGSRIARPDFDSASPIVSVAEDLFQTYRFAHCRGHAQYAAAVRPCVHEHLE
jgi:hypothetical protein